MYAGGTKTFMSAYRDGDKSKPLNLGRYTEGEDQVGLADVRQKLLEFKKQIKAGNKPGGGSNVPKTCAELAEVFYTGRIEKTRTRPDVVRNALDNDITPVIGGKKLATIRTPTLAHLIVGVVERPAPTHAGKVLAIVKQMFSFAEGRGYIDRNPATSLKREDLGVVDSIRERALDCDEEGDAQPELAEIVELWRALDNAPRLSPQIRNGLKILLLTGVRSGELRLARWEHIDFNKGTWFIPKGNTKNAKAWTVPLVPFVLDCSQNCDGHHII